MRTKHGVMAAIAAFAATVAWEAATARTVTVASCDRETGATTLAISAAEAGDGDKALVATWSPAPMRTCACCMAEASTLIHVAIFYHNISKVCIAMFDGGIV